MKTHIYIFCPRLKHINLLLNRLYIMQYFNLYHTSFFKEQKAHNLMFGQSHNQEQWSKEEMISGNEDQDFKTLQELLVECFYTLNSFMLHIQLKCII